MQFGYINNLYIGKICASTNLNGVGTNPIQSGINGNSGIINNTGSNQIVNFNNYNNNCVLYRSGQIISGCFTGISSEYINGNGYGSYSGILKNNITGIEAGIFNGIWSGYFNGSISLTTIGLIEIFSSNIFVSGQFNGNCYGLGYTGDYNPDYSGILSSGNTQAAIVGEFDGILIGSGNIYLSGVDEGNLFSGSQNYYFSGVKTNDYDFSGNSYLNGSINNYSFIGNRLGLVNGNEVEIFSGYITGYCQEPISPVYDNSICSGFAPLMSNCNISGTLDVRYLINNSNYPISSCISYIANQKTGDYIGTGIYLTADIFYPTGDNGGNGSIPNSGVVMPNYLCPTFNYVNPTCESGNDGSIQYTIYNDDQDICGIAPPYNGVFLYQSDLNEDYTLISKGIGLPSKFEFDNLSQGYYTLILSGSTEVLTFLAYLQNTVYIPFNLSIIQLPSDCQSNNSLVRVDYANGVYNYDIDNAYFGSSPTGFTISGLAVGNHSFSITQDNKCTSHTYFDIPPNNSIQGFVNYTGISCTGNVNDGSVVLQGNGGNPPYSFRWLTDPYFNNTNQYLTGLSTGLYSFAVTDSIGCTATQDFYLGFDNRNLNIVTQILNNQTVCCQDNNPKDKATLRAFAVNGKLPYEIIWNTNPPVSGNIGSLDLSGVGPGIYTATVIDGAGCAATSLPLEIDSLNTCLDVKWSCVFTTGTSFSPIRIERPDIYYQEYDYILQPSGIPTSQLFTFTFPGNYLAKVAISDSYGRSGIKCQAINLIPCWDLISGGNPLVPGSPGLSGSLPSSGISGSGSGISGGDNSNNNNNSNYAGGGNFNSGGTNPPSSPPPQPPVPPNPPGGGGGGGGDNPDNHDQICCTLIDIFASKDINGNYFCQAGCSPTLANCVSDIVSPREIGKGSCFPNNDCNKNWTPQAGCICCEKTATYPDNGNLYTKYTCIDYGSHPNPGHLTLNNYLCDPDKVCQQLVAQNGYNKCTWTVDGSCKPNQQNSVKCSEKYPCGVPDGCGTRCIGEFSEEDCVSFGGQIYGQPGNKCGDAGPPTIGIFYPSLGGYYFNLFTINCCKYHTDPFSPPTCCYQTDCVDCLSHQGTVSYIPIDAAPGDPVYQCNNACNCGSSSS